VQAIELRRQDQGAEINRQRDCARSTVSREFAERTDGRLSPGSLAGAAEYIL
jgi:hypothetical protein